MNNVIKLSLFSIILCSITLASVSPHSKLTPTVQAPGTSDVHMIILVHGTLGTFPLTSYKVLKKLTRSKKGAMKRDFEKYSHIVANTFGNRYRYAMRSSPLHNRQPLANFGLSRIKHHKKNRVSTKLTQTVSEKIYTHLAPQDAKKRRYYTFGWSGALTQKARKDWAQELYNDILAEKQRLEKKGKSVFVDILAHSHGGAVALFLNSIPNGQLFIDRLMMFGTPVQSETEHLIHGKVFKKIYHFYSRGDMVQVVDLFSTKDFFSRRKFGKHKKKLVTLPDHFVQIKISGKKHQPRHADLWLFGKKFWPYNARVVTAPVPLFTLAPLIVNQIEKNHQGTRKVKVELRLENSTLFSVVRETKNEKRLSLTLFPYFKKLQQLVKEAFS